ncbi:H-NS histone family protein [Paraburkholderia sediminicola]|uniref:H-NS histone family protein n=1 Tax=Paraburkholderia sediminicola TaxID=458836 RepID=UPI0038BCB2CA
MAQQAALEEQIAIAREAEVGAVMEQIRKLVAEYGLENEVTFTRARVQKRAAVAPKYRDPETGNTWSGRGKPPSWIKGKDKEQFLIA